MKQKMRFNDTELELLNVLFADRDDLLISIRKAFYNLELTDKDKQNLAIFERPENLKLLRKVFLPEIEADAPIRQVADLYMFYKPTEQSEDDRNMTLGALLNLVSQLESALGNLTGVKNYTVDIQRMSDKSCCITPQMILARNSFVAHIEAQLDQISILAGTKKESLEEIRKRLHQDSSK